MQQSKQGHSELAMIDSPLAVELGNEIRLYIRQRGFTQRILADRLAVSSTIFSRMLNGKINFSIEQLEILLTFLNPDCETREKWRRICWSFAEEQENKTKENSHRFKALRQKRGLTLPMLSNRTGIKTSKLTSFENGIGALTEQENAVLLRVLGVKDSSYNKDSGSSPIQTSLPLLYLNDFSLFDCNKKLSELTSARSCQMIYWEVYSEGPAVAVLTECRNLQLAMPGFAIFVVTERGYQPTSGVEFCCDSGGNYFLQEWQDDNLQLYPYTNPDAVAGEVRWSLPLIDMVCKPFNFTLGEND